MNKLVSTVYIIFSAFCITETPVKVTWQQLQNITYEDKYIEEVKAKMMFPRFTFELRRLAGETVDIEGYVIPVDKTGMFVALSANPYAACYFCGKGGPASVMTAKLKKKNTRYRVDDYKTFRGILRLNSTDIHEFYYILESAEEVAN